MLASINESQTAYFYRSSAWQVGLCCYCSADGAVGLYGVIAYSVSQRTREIGVRIALDAQRGAVCQLILKEGGWLTVCGVAIGVVCSPAASLALRSILFEVKSLDVATVVVVTVVLASASMLASYIPARRAASVDPVERWVRSRYLYNLHRGPQRDGDYLESF